MLVHGGKPESFLLAVIIALLSAVVHLHRKKRRKSVWNISSQWLLCVLLVHFEGFFVLLLMYKTHLRSLQKKD